MHRKHPYKPYGIFSEIPDRMEMRGSVWISTMIHDYSEYGMDSDTILVHVQNKSDFTYLLRPL